MSDELSPESRALLERLRERESAPVESSAQFRQRLAARRHAAIPSASWSVAIPAAIAICLVLALALLRSSDGDVRVVPEGPVTERAPDASQPAPPLVAQRVTFDAAIARDAAITLDGSASIDASTRRRDASATRDASPSPSREGAKDSGASNPPPFYVERPMPPPSLKGTLFLSTVPASQCTITPGPLVHATPWRVLLEPGRYEVRCTNSDLGASASWTFTISAGETLRMLNHRLE